MKKLFIGIVYVVTIASCGPKKDKQQPLIAKALTSLTADSVAKTLNGYSQIEADKYVKYCYGTKDTKPADTQIWFKKDIVLEMNKLLSADSNGTYKPDGIRIYFSRFKASIDTPIHLNNTIVIVPTYAKDSLINGVMTTIHKDYFKHPKNSTLFNIGKIQGEVTHYSDTTMGALLYGIYKGNLRNCPLPSTVHEIPRWKAEKMVQRFHRKLFRTGKINAKAEWFKIDMFTDLVSRLNDAHSKCDGIRIYFGRGYKKDSDKNKARLIFALTVPEKFGSVDIHKDYFTCDPRHRFFGNNYFADTDSDAQDNGELCPINCNGATLQNGN